MGKITEQLHRQITGWRVYSVIAPAIFAGASALLYLHYGTSFQNIFYTGLIILSITCISWWHWSLSTMITMLSIMKDTDDHFEEVVEKLGDLQNSLQEHKDNIIFLKDLDKDK
jgi:hypothetical protein